MKKRLLIILFVIVTCFILVGCGKNVENNDLNKLPQKENDTATSQENVGSNKTVKVVSGVPLKEYKDSDLGYTLLCPDLNYTQTDSYLYTDVWWYRKNKEDKDDTLLFGYSEYQEGVSKHDAKALNITDPQELLDYFMYFIGKTTSNWMIHLTDSSCTPEWKKMTVSGLQAAEFKCVMDDVSYDSNYHRNGDNKIGLVGITVVGKKRPYIFWAADLSLEQKEMNTATKVLEAAVESFNEGN